MQPGDSNPNSPLMPADFRTRARARVRTRAAIVLFSAAALVLLISPISAASAQIAFQHAPERLPAGEPANLFVEVTGTETIDGVVLALPASWVLDEIRIVDDAGQETGFTTEPLVEYANRWLILADNPIHYSASLVLTVNPVSPSAASTATVTPVRLGNSAGDRDEIRVLDHLRSRASLPVISEVNTTIGRSADFSPRAARLSRDAGAASRFLPFDADLLPGPWDAFTMEAWLKTTDFKQIVLSTWTGRDGDPYPFELMVDGSGHIVSYQGTEDHHVSMRSDRPIADGTWHHVAVVHDSPDGWTRLIVDGMRADSLVHRRTMTFRQPEGLAMGTRVTGGDSDGSAESFGYTGKLDQVRVWPTARSVEDIRASRLDSRTFEMGSGLELSFDDDQDTDLDIPVSEDSPFTKRGITDLTVRSGSGVVTITWRAPEKDALSYVVERSSDGHRYSVAGRLQAGLPAGASYSIADPDPGVGVMYYRIRELLSDGEERLSDAVKVGMGESGEELSVILTGNFPNPFNPTTRISYTVRETQYVQISVWDLSGQQVRVLVDQTLSPGYHEVTFDAEGLPSGTYFVRLSTSEGTRTHQMVLMK